MHTELEGIAYREGHVDVSSVGDAMTRDRWREDCDNGDALCQGYLVLSQSCPLACRPIFPVFSLCPHHTLPSVSHTNPPGVCSPTASQLHSEQSPSTLHLAASLCFSHLSPAFKKLLCLGLWLSLSWLLPPPSSLRPLLSLSCEYQEPWIITLLFTMELLPGRKQQCAWEASDLKMPIDSSSYL